MKKVSLILATLLGVSCGGGASKASEPATKTEMEYLEARLRQHIAQERLDIEKNLSEAKGKLPDVLAAEARVKAALEELRKLQAEVEEDRKQMEQKVTAAREELLQVLEGEEKLLVDRLRTLRAVLEQLREGRPSENMPK